MKKAIIGVAIAAVIGGGSYFALQKAGAAFGDEQLKAQIELYKKQSYTIQSIQAHPLVERADIKITEATDDVIKSVLTIDIIDENPVEIPLTSVITRGKATYQDKSFGYGKIVTTPDVATLDLPEFIKADTLTNTTYLGLDGALLNVTSVQPINNPKEHIAFKGAVATFDSNIANTSVYDVNFNFKGLIGEDGSKSVDFQPFDMTFALDKDGKLVGHSSPIIFEASKYGKTTSFKLGKGDYQGFYKKVEGVKVPIGNGSATFAGATISDRNQEVIFTQITMGGGYYEAKNNLLDMKVNFSANLDADNSNLLKNLPVKVTPQSLSLEYGLTNIGYDVVNLYIDAVQNLQPYVDEIPLSDDEKKMLVQSMQKTGTGFFLNANLKTAEGNADADANFTFSEKGKTVTIAEIEDAFKQRTPNQALALLVGKANLNVSKKLANATQTTFYLMMGQAKEEQDNYVINAELKDGIFTVNGQPMM